MNCGYLLYHFFPRKKLFTYYCSNFKDRNECRISFDYITTYKTTMSIANSLSINLTPLRLKPASSVRIPHSVRNFQNLLPSVRIKTLNLQSASSDNLRGLSNLNSLTKSKIITNKITNSSHIL